MKFCLSLQDPNQRVILDFFEELITIEEGEEYLPSSKRVRLTWEMWFQALQGDFCLLLFLHDTTDG